MQNKILLATVSAFFILHSAFGQGALTPPGAPAPTMKTLAQIEPRIAIAAAPFTISSSGSYYLTTNVSVSSGDAITIATNGVTLDLNGFTISSTAASAAGNGIFLGGSNPKDITILNGHIQSGVTNNGSGVFNGSGFANGIYYGNLPVNVLVSKVSVSGCLSSGINLNTGDATTVEGCTVRTMGFVGITATTVKGCEAIDCGGYGIIATQVSDSRGVSASAGGAGISATTAQNCYGQSTGNGSGILATTAQNCYGSSFGNGAGIGVTIALNCYGFSLGNGAGIGVTIALNCYGFSLGNGAGIGATTAQNCFGYSVNASGFHLNDGGTLTGCSASSSVTGITAGNRCTIKDCAASNNSTNGIMVGQSCRVSGCIASENGTGTTGIGISVGIRTTVENCTVNDNRGDGLLASGDCTVLNNHTSHNGLGIAGAAGIHATGAGSRIDGNHTRDNSGYGIKSDGGAGADTIVRNTSGGNGTAQYSPTTGTTFAPVQTPATMTNPSANF